MRRWFRWIVCLLLLTILVFLGVSWGYARRLTGPRPSQVGDVPTDMGFPIESVTLMTSDRHTLSGWFAPTDDRHKAIVLLHGFGGSRVSMLPRARFFRKQGYAVLLYDARACGESTGDCITFGYHERHDLLAAVRFLQDRKYESVACLGVSQGGATILYAARDLPDIRCVICESTYDEMRHAVDRRMRRYTGLPGWLAGSALVPFAEARLGLPIDAFRPIDQIASLRCPIFIISGDQDNRAWPEDTERLHAAAGESKELWMVEGAGHEDLFRHPGYEDKVSAFLRRHFETQ